MMNIDMLIKAMAVRDVQAVTIHPSGLIRLTHRHGVTQMSLGELAAWFGTVPEKARPWPVIEVQPGQDGWKEIACSINDSMNEKLAAVAMHGEMLESLGVDLRALAGRVAELEKDRAPNRLDRIKATVAQHFCISLEDMLGSRRHARAVWPRQVAMWLVRELTGKSIGWVAGSFGGWHAGTVRHAVKQVANRMACEPGTKAEIEKLKLTNEKDNTRG